MLEKTKEKLQKARKRMRVAAVSAGMALAMAVPVFAVEADPGSGFKINFDVTQMFTVAQPLIDGMMPVVYITAGLGLAFMIINALKNAFR